jgi:hypothetical protein
MRGFWDVLVGYHDFEAIVVGDFPSDFRVKTRQEAGLSKRRYAKVLKSLMGALNAYYPVKYTDDGPTHSQQMLSNELDEYSQGGWQHPPKHPRD